MLAVFLTWSKVLNCVYHNRGFYECKLNRTNQINGGIPNFLPSSQVRQMTNCSWTWSKSALPTSPHWSIIHCSSVLTKSYMAMWKALLPGTCFFPSSWVSWCHAAASQDTTARIIAMQPGPQNMVSACVFVYIHWKVTLQNGFNPYAVAIQIPVTCSSAWMEATPSAMSIQHSHPSTYRLHREGRSLQWFAGPRECKSL